MVSIIFALVTLSGCGESIELTRGTIEGNIYTNKSAELTFTAPEGWQYATDEEIAEMLGTAADIMDQSGSELSDDMIKKVNTYDMFVIDTETKAGVNVMYQDLGAAHVYIDEEPLFDLMKEQFEKATPYDCEFSDYSEVKIGSRTFKAMFITYMDYGDIPCTKYIYIRRAGSYMLNITVTIFNNKNDIDSIIANFS